MDFDNQNSVVEALQAKAVAREAELGRANAEPFPGTLADAFDPVAKRVAGFTVRPVVPFDHQVFRAINSPLYRQILEQSKPEAERRQTEFTDDDEWDMLFQFLTPAREVAKAITAGPEEFRRVAKEAFAFNEAMTILTKQLLLQLIVEGVARSYSTIVETKQRSGGMGSTVNFRQPPTDLMTGSAGGSPTSPVS